MIITTTPTIEGHTIKEYKGLVSGEVIFGMNVLKDFGASLRDFFGGRFVRFLMYQSRLKTIPILSICLQDWYFFCTFALVLSA